MRLDAQAPLRVPHTVLDSLRGMGAAQRTVHGLNEKMIECELRERFWRRIGLWIHQFEFVAARDNQGIASLGTDAHPVDAGRDRQSTVGFDSNRKALGVYGFDQRRIELQ